MHWSRRLMSVGWPAFLAACVLELVVFAAVDPHDLGWFEALELSRQTFYALAFAVFWSITAASGWLTAWLTLPQDAPEAEAGPEVRPD